MTAARIRRLLLTNFRSYRVLDLVAGKRLVVLVGPNGAGKTNLIEAISLLSPGRGLRRATLADVASTEGDGSWAIAADVEGALGLARLGTGLDRPGADGAAEIRRCRIDREPVGSAAAFAAHLRVVWLTPAMDGLFGGPASERRRFLDRLALTIDPAHGARVSALERSLRARNRLLEDPRPDPHWLAAVEHETAEIAVAVAAGRRETVEQLSGALAARKDEGALFPAARIRLDGWMEAALGEASALAVEDRYRAVLRENRARDAAARRTLHGPHLTDFRVEHAAKGIDAADASTGEQKALLIGLVLAHAGLIATLVGVAPVILLDEVVAHLDPARRRALYERLEGLRAQVWMTGADPAAFSEIAPQAEVVDVAPGGAEPRLIAA